MIFKRLLKLKPNLSKMIKSKKFFAICHTKNNVLKFNYIQSGLSEKDMLNLFMGFIKLIKRTAEEQAEMKYRNIIIDLKKKMKI